MEQYRSGHNEADSKSVSLSRPVGSNPTCSAKQKLFAFFGKELFCLEGSPLRGSFFGSKVWNSTSKYHRVIWQCNNKFKGDHKCETPHMDEETIKARFVVTFNAVLDSKDNILEDCRLMQTTLTNYTGVDEEIQSLLEEIDVVTELTKRCIAENSQPAQNQAEYKARYNDFVARYEKAKTRVEELRSIKNARQAQADTIGAFMFEVQELDTLSEFNEKLWLTVIDTVTVYADGRITLKFQGDTEINA